MNDNKSNEDEQGMTLLISIEPIQEAIDAFLSHRKRRIKFIKAIGLLDSFPLNHLGAEDFAAVVKAAKSLQSRAMEEGRRRDTANLPPEIVEEIHGVDSRSVVIPEFRPTNEEARERLERLLKPITKTQYFRNNQPPGRVSGCFGESDQTKEGD